MAFWSTGDILWAIVVVGGPIVLILALVYAMTRNKQSPREERRTEEATRANYRAEAAADDRAEGQRP